MTEQTKAHRLVDEAHNDEWIAGTKQWREEAAAELRRLDVLVDELVEALEGVLDYTEWHNQSGYDAFQKAISTLKKAKE